MSKIRHWGAATIAAVVLGGATQARSQSVSDAIQTLNFNTSGSVATYALNGTNMDFGSFYTRGTCAGLANGTAAVVTGTTATYSAECGSFDVAVTVRLLSPLPSLPTGSGGFEFEYRYTNPTGATLPLTALADSDSDLMITVADDVASYDAGAKAVVNLDTVVNPDGMMAIITDSDQAGATFGWDVAQLGNATLSFPMADRVGPTGPTDTELAIGWFQNVPAGQTATIKWRVLYARGVTTVPADFDFSGCYSSPSNVCRGGAKSAIGWKDNTDDAKDKLTWKLSGADATSQVEFADPTDDGDYTMCVYENGAHIAGVHVAASSTKWAAAGTKGYKYTDVAAASSGVSKALLKGSDAAKTKILVKAAGVNLPDPGLGALAVPVGVQLNTGGLPGLCWEAEFLSPIANDISRFKAKTP